MARRFTDDEDRFIVEHYGTLTIRAIATQLDCKYAQVQVRTHALARKHLINPDARAYHRPWTPQEDAEIRGRLGWDQPATIAKDLRRTEHAVIIRSKRLGLSRHQLRIQRARYTARDVGKIFGVDSKSVTEIWMARGWIKGRRSIVRCGRNRRWEFSYDQVEKFVRDGAAHYDRHRIQVGTWWRELADKVAAANPLLTTRQAASHSGFHPHTLVRWIGEGRLKAIRTVGASVQGDWKIPLAELDRFIAANPLAVRLSRGVRRGRYGQAVAV